MKVYPSYVGFMVLLLSELGCQSSSPDKFPAKPFQFDPNQVQELTLIKADPETGDHWLTRIQRDPVGRKNWEFSTTPLDQPLLDKVADETFILHLLDEMKAIQILSEAPKGPLDSYALDPPRYGVKWRTAEQSFEFRIGSRLPQSGGTYFTQDGVHVYIATGPALRMLDMIESFQFLRKKTWTTVVQDDIDEIHLFKKGKLFLYAQREGERWTDKKHRRIKKDMETFLNSTVSAQPHSFLDNSEQAAKIKKEIQNSVLFEAVLSDRHGNKTSIKLTQQDRTVYGYNSTRPSSVFILDPSILQEFEQRPEKTQ